MSVLKAPPVVVEPVVEEPVDKKSVRKNQGNFSSMRPCDMIIVEHEKGIEVTTSIGDYFCGSMKDFKKLLEG